MSSILVYENLLPGLLHHLTRTTISIISFEHHFTTHRICVAVPLPPDQVVRLEVFVGRVGDAAASRNRQSLHVQSISTWAPACIGPYSQCVEYRPTNLLLLAGQIALDPGSMTLQQAASSVEEYSQCMKHVESVLNAQGISAAASSLCSTIVCVTNAEHARELLNSRAYQQFASVEASFLPLLLLLVPPISSLTLFFFRVLGTSFLAVGIFP